MDVVNSIRDCLKIWTKGGEAECRVILTPPHCNPTDPACLDVLTTAYHTLLCNTLATWTPSNPTSTPAPTLTPLAFADFVQSVLRGLPSTSNGSDKLASRESVFGDHLVDMIWTVDTELDELLNEARTAIASVEGQPLSRDLATSVNKARRAQQNAEADKQRIPAIVVKLLEYQIISPHHCRERLESTVLASVGLIMDKNMQDKTEIRKRTGLFYKQNKFNLLREQSEGYSKLVIELTSNLGPPHSSQTGRPTESYGVIEERARPVWEKVISLIGYFDLDPNRALDVILDVLSQHLTTHYTFFLALLSFSPWSGSYRRPVPEIEAMDTKTDIPEGAYKGKSFDDVLTIAEEHALPTTPTQAKIGGARVLAQVLGFKFSYYQSQEASESTPRSLYLTTAVLIREGFITLEDLYPHLLPNDEDMDVYHKEYLSNVKSRISTAKNSLLAMAAPLESSGQSSMQPKASSAASVTDPKKAETKNGNQKVGLLTGLLAVGALKPALAILSKNPWLVDANPEIADLILNAMKVSISPLYEKTLVTKKRNPGFTQPRPRYGSSGLVSPNPRRSVLTLWAPTPPSTSTIDFEFFFPDWADRIPLCSSLDDLEDVIQPLLHFVGLHVYRDLNFTSKFLRLGRSHMLSTFPFDASGKRVIGELDPQQPIPRLWLSILRQYVLPALSMSRGNAVFTVDVWNLVRQYPTNVRWSLYGEWKANSYRVHPELQIREVQADRESKGILRRLSHNTIDALVGPVAKMVHSNPCIFFHNAVNQVMSYDNLAPVVIQSLRYTTSMGYDVLVFIVLNALANPDKQRVKNDGVNTSDWLQSLASFVGQLFRRYSADLTSVLKYIVHQLYNGQTSEIVVLRELIWKMAGIEPLPSLSESQMAAMAGGPTLRIEAIASSARGARLDPSEAQYKGPQRLGKSLLETNLALPLLIQVAQQRQACVFKASNTHLKSLAGLYDATHGVLLQYLELLTSPSVIPPDDYANKVLPPLRELGQEYGIDAPLCMQIIRPVLNASLLTSALAMQEQERIANEEAEKRLKAALTAKREPGATASRTASPAIGNHQPADMKSTTEETESAMEVDATALITTPHKEDSPWVPELEKLFDDIQAIAPGNAYDVIGPGFYLTFWQLSTYDLSPPGAKYDEEGSKLRQLSRQEDSKYASADKSADRAKRATATAHRQRRDRYNQFVSLLAREFKDQTASRAFTIKRLAKEKQHWFAHASKSAILINSIIEHCIQPRCLLSPMDADFCSQFIKILHLQGTPNFHTLGCYDKLLGDHVKVILFSCSEYEARNYGRFLLGILRDLLNWHLDEATFLQDNRTKVGGKTLILPGLQGKFTTGSPVVPGAVLKWPQLQQVIRKWYRKLAKSFIDCIQTNEFMHVYNAIIVMKEILEVFPLASVNESGPAICSAVERLVETEERGDLKILAKSYYAGLKKKEADWLPKGSALVNGGVSPRPPSTSTNSPLPEKPRNLPTGPSALSHEARRNVSQLPASVPSAPRSQIASQNAQSNSERGTSGANATKFSESIPRPEVVKRVRPEAKASDAVQGASDNSMSPRIDSDRRNLPSAASSRDEVYQASLPENPIKLTSKDGTSHQNGVSSRDYAEPSRPYRPDQTQSIGDNGPVMPPPTVPSQTASAQELRETARQTIGRSERPEGRSQNGSAAPSPRVRSPSPPSRPGTRNPSNESRTSGGKSRSDSGRESRTEAKDPSTTVSRRDSLTHNRSERSVRDRGRDDKDNDRERDRDRGRDRHGDRDREKDRERDRERDRDRDRDRHRRDDKDRDRDTRKERENAPNRTQPVHVPPASTDDRSLPSRPDAPRHRSAQQAADDALGKRRRAGEDDADRSSKRSSRKESHRDDRSRRPPDKEERPREADGRRRKEREAPDLTDKPREPTKQPVIPPSGPRAMGPSIPSRGNLRDNPAESGPSTPPQDSGSRNTVSLRSRIGDKEPPVSFRDADQREREIQRKRTASDRDGETEYGVAGVGDNGPVPPKRPRPSNANSARRYPQAGGVARRTLPIDRLIDKR